MVYEGAIWFMDCGTNHSKSGFRAQISEMCTHPIGLNILLVWELIESPLICHIMNLLWLLSDRGTHARVYWVPRHYGIASKRNSSTKPERRRSSLPKLWIGQTKPTKSHLLPRGLSTVCQYCGQILTIDHIVLVCTVLQESSDKYYTADSLKPPLKTIPEACVVEFLREAGMFYLILTLRHARHFTWTNSELIHFCIWTCPHSCTLKLGFINLIIYY